MTTCETMKVKADGELGYMIINCCDFDKEVHKKLVSRRTKAEMEEAKIEVKVKEDKK